MASDEVHLAKLAELAERYDDIIKSIKRMCEINADLSVEERNLLSMAYENKVGSLRASWWIITANEQKEEQKGETEHLRLTKVYRQKVESELEEICNDAISVVDTYLIPQASNAEAIVFYKKMKEDYYRYLSEIKVSVATPMEKGAKRHHDEDTEIKPLEFPIERPDYAQGPHHNELALCLTLKAPEIDNLVHLDAYEASLALLSPVVRDRLNRLFRLGIGTQYDIDIRCIYSLKDLPDQAAIAALDQFLFSGSDKHDKRAFFNTLVAKQRANLLIRSNYSSQAPHIEPAVDHPPRYIMYSSSPGLYTSSSQCSKEPLFSQNPIVELQEETASFHREQLVGTLSLGYGTSSRSEEQLLPLVTPDRRQIRYDPFTGQPYKFDPFTGEPIEPEFGSHQFRSLR